MTHEDRRLLQQMFDAIQEELGIAPEQLKAKTRKANIVEARALFYKILYSGTPLKTKTICSAIFRHRRIAPHYLALCRDRQIYADFCIKEKKLRAKFAEKERAYRESIHAANTQTLPFFAANEYLHQNLPPTDANFFETMADTEKEATIVTLGKEVTVYFFTKYGNEVEYTASMPEEPENINPKYEETC